MSITGATFNRYAKAALSGEASSARLVPPRFDACVAHLRAELAVTREPRVSTAQLRANCTGQYQAVLRQVLDPLIANQWLLLGERELNVHTSARAAAASLERYRQENFSDEEEFQSFLAGRTEADFLSDRRAGLAAQAIRRVVEAGAPPPTGAQTRAYYDRHRYDYLLDAERDLQIVRSLSKTAAAKARSEIEAGQSFANEEQKLQSFHVLYSQGGLVMGLKPHVYGEPGLDEAIFTAKPGVLLGPLNTRYGYFVFKITKVRRERKKPLERVRSGIETKLARQARASALARFVRDWQAKWAARTECAPSAVVPNCREFEGPLPEPPAGLSLLG